MDSSSYPVAINDSTNYQASTFTNGTVAPVTVTTLSLFSEDERRTLRIIAMTFASLSLLAGTLMLYWYVRLPKRTFRLTLILGLIGSDMLRSTLELAYPIVTLAQGDVSVGSLYCDIGGFFTAYFFEASDLMIFIIAIHTAIYVFNPKLTQSADEGGLWRWRYYVFAFWLAIPALLGGLAFINPVPYVPLVTWCYIPAQPLVWRYALAWGPRYFILLTISVLYVSLYIHVRRVYRKVDRTQRESGSTDSEPDTTHGSVPSQGHAPRSDFMLHAPPPSYLNRKRPSIPAPLFEESEKESRASTTQSITDNPSPTSASSIINYQPIKPEFHLLSHQSAIEPRNMSVTTTLAEYQPPSIRDAPPAADQAAHSFSNQRSRVERQMRTLFIFPIVYFIMWIPPFINHLYQVITFDSTATHLPAGTYVVTLLATIVLPAQGLVNVCIYAIRERPWRRRRNNNRVSTISATTRVGRMATTLSEWKGLHGDEKLTEPSSTEDIQAQIDQAKLTQLRSANPAQAAYARRDVERVERELARAHTVDSRPTPANWWDAQDDIEANRV